MKESKDITKNECIGIMIVGIAMATLLFFNFFLARFLMVLFFLTTVYSAAMVLKEIKRRERNTND